jgi:hypothetical protein
MSSHGENTEVEEGRKLKRKAEEERRRGQKERSNGAIERRERGRARISLTLVKHFVFGFTFRPFCSKICIFQEEFE